MENPKPVIKLNDNLFYRLAERVYKVDSKKIKKINIRKQQWLIVQEKEWKTKDKKSGFKAIVFKNNTNIIIAFAGTDVTDPGDLINDVGIAIPLLKKALDSINLKESKLYIFQAQNSLK